MGMMSFNLHLRNPNKEDVIADFYDNNSVVRSVTLQIRSSTVLNWMLSR